ncbi:MAG: type III secretion system chaperone [Verrucomicrobiota bacterium]|nr:type III secretion system chaperone [Verrucomicrobiota bacterium]
MLRRLLEIVCKEVDLPPAKEVERGRCFILPFAPGIEIKLSDLQPGVSMSASLIACPKRNKEDLFIYVMEANLLGQGTGSARIGMENEELMLLSGFPYELDASLFKDKLEEFLNTLLYWRKDLERFS